MRRWIRCDCTGEPPGELISSATALARRVVNAFSSGRATLASVRPGRSGVERPIAPDSRTTGTTAPPPRMRFGSQRAHAPRAGRPASGANVRTCRLAVPCSAMALSAASSQRGQDFAPRPAHCRCIGRRSGLDLGTSYQFSTIGMLLATTSCQQARVGRTSTMEIKIFVLLALIAAIATASHFGEPQPVAGTRELRFCSGARRQLHGQLHKPRCTASVPPRDTARSRYPAAPRRRAAPRRPRPSAALTHRRAPAAATARAAPGSP